MTMRIRLLSVATTALLMALVGPARAADISFVTGGAGADERDQLQANEKDYNLKIVAAATSGDYLCVARVCARDPRVLARYANGERPKCRLNTLQKHDAVVKPTWAAMPVTDCSSLFSACVACARRWPIT